MKTLNNPATLRSCTVCVDNDVNPIGVDPDVVVKIGCIGVDYRQYGMSNPTRAIKVLRRAIETLEKM